MAKISSTFLLATFWVMVLFPTQAVSYSNSAESFGKPAASQAMKTRKIIYTIRENESLGQIAKYFGIEPALLAELNSLKNPDLIYPGSKLNIQVQDDFSLRVTETERSGLQNSPDNKQVVIQVTEPSRTDIFAPENPLVEVTMIKHTPSNRQLMVDILLLDLHGQLMGILQVIMVMLIVG